MGGATSKDDGFHFATREEYAAWNADSVNAAVDTWVTAGKQLRVKRAGFFDTFMDYSTIVDGGFLSLSMAQFEIFAAGKQEIFMPEVFIMLLAFGKGSMDSRAKVAFRVFCISHRSHMSIPDMIILVTALMGALKKFNLVTRTLSTEEMEKLATDNFASADEDGDATISFEEFLPWFRSNMETHHLVASLKVQSQAPTTGTAAATKDKTPSRRQRVATAKAKRSRGKRSGGANHGGGKALEVDTAMYSEALMGGDSEDASLLRQHAERTRKQKMQTIASRRVLNQLKGQCDFSIVELQKIAGIFVDVSDAVGLVNVSDFAKLLSTHLKTPLTEEMMASLHAVCDADGSGKLDYKEFILAFSKILRGGLADKVGLLFQMFDEDGSGGIDVMELITIIQDGNDELKDCLEFAEETMMSLDADGDGQVSREELVDAMGRHPDFASTMASLIRATRSEAEALHGLKAELGSVPASLLQSVVGKYPGASRDVLHQAMTEEAMGVFLGRVLEFDPSEHTKALHRVFQAFCSSSWRSTRAKSGRRSGKEDVFTVFGPRIISGMSQAIGMSPEDRVLLYFDLYDAAGDGKMDRREVMDLVLSTEKVRNDDAEAVVSLLQGLDKDGDGTITKEEFMARASRQPELMDVIDRLFGVTSRNL
jgi:Ca2+-binding EF-hand superfamily protein